VNPNMPNMGYQQGRMVDPSQQQQQQQQMMGMNGQGGYPQQWSQQGNPTPNQGQQ